MGSDRCGLALSPRNIGLSDATVIDPLHVSIEFRQRPVL